MSEFTFQCPKCKGEVKAETADVGLQGECPQCNGAVLVPEPPPPATGNSPMSSQPGHLPATPKKGGGFVVAGWICFGLGMVLICLFPFNLPLLMASFGLGIAAIVTNKGGQGVALILCSICVPIVSAILLPMLLAGSLLSMVGLGALSETAKSSKAPSRTISSSKNTAMSVPQIIESPVKEKISVPSLKTSDVLVQFLAQMEGYSRAYARENTTVKKDEAKNLAIEKAKTLLHGQIVTLSVIVKDVGTPKDGLVTIKTGDLDLGGYKDVEGKTLSITMLDYYGLEMDRDQALTVAPGSELELTGALSFETDTRYVFGQPFREAQPLFRLGFNTHPFPFGAVVMKDVKWRIIPAARAGG